MTARSYFPAELAICARGDAHLEKGASSLGWVHVSVSGIIQLLANGSMCELESELWLSDGPFIHVFSLQSGLESVHLHWSLRTLRSLCSTSPNTGELTKERLKLKQGMSMFHPEVPEWKGRMRLKTWCLLNVLFPFSFWMISLSWHILRDVCLFSMPAREISHSTHQFLPLHPNRVALSYFWRASMPS